MSKQNDINSTESKSEQVPVTEKIVDECVLSGGERIPVKQEERTIHNEIDDYVFVKPHRKKRVVTKVTDGDDITYVKSTRPAFGSKIKKPKKKMKKWKKVLISIGCVLLGLIVCCVGFVAGLYIKGGSELFEDNYVITAPEVADVQNSGEFIYYNGKTYEYNEDVTSILFMGIDKRVLEQNDINGDSGQADVLVLLSVDTSTGKMTMTNVSRDTMADVAVYSSNGGYVGLEKQQICLSYAYGDGRESSCEYTVDAVKKLFYNVPIKTYLSLDLDGIAAVNDSVGGVDVISPETIGKFVKNSSYHLEGSLAESFVRARSHETADANSLRMQRQQTYVNAFLNKMIAKTKTDIGTPIDMFNEASPYICTNLNASRVSYLAGVALSNNISIETKTVPGKVQMGDRYAEFIVDEGKFFEMFLDIFYNEV